MKVLITGANGFIGRNLCGFLRKKSYFVRVAVRSNVRDISGVDEYIQVGDINESTDWQQALEGVDVVVHLAARVHMMRDEVKAPLVEYRRVNVEGTRQLAKAAMEVGVKRLVFLSTIKVNGEETTIDKPFREDDKVDPQDDYAVSKWEAENILQDFSSQKAFELVVIRSPLVYGPDVKANFKKLLRMSDFPLPLRNINNQRSFIFLGNLVDAIKMCVTRPSASGETFLVGDGQDVSISDLIRMIAIAKNKNSKLFFVPLSILKILMKAIGKEEVLTRLIGSLVVDSSKIRGLLYWNPPFTLEEGIRKTVEECKL